MTIIKNKGKPPEARVEDNDESQNNNQNRNDSHLRTVDIQVEDRSQERVREDIQLSLRNERLSPSQHHQVRDEKRSGLEDNADTGPSHSKRRHKASPLRSRRSKLSERGSCSPPASTSNASVPNNSGYNSEDEYDHTLKPTTGQDWAKKDAIFEKRMRMRGFVVKNMSEDGACLFRSVADQVYGDQNMHALVRKSCMDYLATNSDYFSQYVTEDFSKYVTRKRENYTHGNHVELQAMSEIYNRKIEVYCYGLEPINIFYGVEQNDYEPIRLSYQRDSHYNSIVNPNKSSIGCGLGLPSFSHGAADSKLIKEALRKREDYQIEQALLENKLQASDWEATSEAISEQIARESYLQWIRDNEKRDKEKFGSASTNYDEPGSHRSVKTSTQLSPRLADKGDDHFSLEGKGQLDSNLYGLSSWEDNMLAEVLAASERDYLENLRKTLGSCSKNDNDAKPSTSR